MNNNLLIIFNYHTFVKLPKQCTFALSIVTNAMF